MMMRLKTVMVSTASVLAMGICAPMAFADSKLPRFSSLKAFKVCAQGYESEHCLEALDRYVAKHPAQAGEAARLVRLHVHANKALPYFSRALQGKSPSVRCDDADLLISVNSGLYLPFEEPNAKLARGILGQFCYSPMLPHVQKALADDGGNRYLRANACAVLLEKDRSPVCAMKTDSN